MTNKNEPAAQTVTEEVMHATSVLITPPEDSASPIALRLYIRDDNMGEVAILHRDSGAPAIVLPLDTLSELDAMVAHAQARAQQVMVSADLRPSDAEGTR